MPRQTPSPEQQIELAEKIINCYAADLLQAELAQCLAGDAAAAAKSATCRYDNKTQQFTISAANEASMMALFHKTDDLCHLARDERIKRILLTHPGRAMPPFQISPKMLWD